MSKNLIIVFTRNPELGKCKTRLATSIGNKNALEVYKRLVAHTSKTIQQVKVDAVVFYTEKIQKNDTWNDDFFQKQIQIEGHLGEKMQAAFEWGFAKGYEKICIIGSDLLDLKSSNLTKAFQQLEKPHSASNPAE